jgi:eukaryotic-like serine/threonine-protein kinase
MRYSPRAPMDQIATPTDYEFAGFRLNTALQVLVSPEGTARPLNNRAFQTLLVLVQHPGETLDKRFLLRRVWPDVVVEENNLNQCIAAIRRAVGESATDRKFILTIPGRGFKFVAPVREVLPQSISEPTPPAGEVTQQLEPSGMPPVANGTARRRRILTAVAAIALACAVSIGIFLLWQRPVTRPAEYEQLTDDFESAGAPALSADGRFLAYVRGGGQFISHGQIYVKALPSGEPMRLTQVDSAIFAPSFSADGAQLTFTLVGGSGDPGEWSTWIVPVTGGEPTVLLPNASGLTWLAPDRVMYSEVKSGSHMGIVTSTLSRADRREIYFPAHERGMAHFSFPSPDRRHLIVAEMNGAGEFQQCRLIDVASRSPGHLIGPPSACLSAAWSPDGRWMYFAADIHGHSHIWRARFPDGTPQQITFGPMEEMAVVATPDGRSLISSVGLDNSSIWLHSEHGETQLTTDRLGYSPWLSRDRQRLYYLRSNPNSHLAGQLMRDDLVRHRSDVLLPDFDIESYDISPDERTVAFATIRDGESRVWVAATDRRTAPRLSARGADHPLLTAVGQIFCRQGSDSKNVLRRCDLSTTPAKAILNTPILDLFGVSPDGEWVSVGIELDHRAVSGIYNTRTGEQAWGAAGYRPARWSPDGKLIYIQSPGEQSELTLAVPTNPDGSPRNPDINATGVQRIPHELEDFFPGLDATTYVFVKHERHRNIFRIPLH